eukprot:2480774-Rhodomonas_salina.1
MIITPGPDRTDWHFASSSSLSGSFLPPFLPSSSPCSESSLREGGREGECRRERHWKGGMRNEGGKQTK